MARVTPPNLTLFLTGYLRDRAAARGITAAQLLVGSKEPKTLTVTSPDQIVVRDDSGPRASVVTFERSVGVSVLAGTKANDFPADELARDVLADLTDDAILTWPGSPIAAIDYGAVNGPYAVPEQLDKARRYMVVGYTVIGSW